MTRLITFLRNLITAPELPALILFVAAGLCAWLALIAVGHGDMGRAYGVDERTARRWRSN